MTNHFRDAKLSKIGNALNDLEYLTVKSALYTLMYTPHQPKFVCFQDTNLLRVRNVPTDLTHWALNSQKYPLYKIVENQKYIKYPQNDLEHLAVNSSLYTLSRYLWGPNLGLCHSTISPFRDTRLLEMHRMAFKWPWILKHQKCCLCPLNTYPQAQIFIHCALWTAVLRDNVVKIETPEMYQWPQTDLEHLTVKSTQYTLNKYSQGPNLGVSFALWPVIFEVNKRLKIRKLGNVLNDFTDWPCYPICTKYIPPPPPPGQNLSLLCSTNRDTRYKIGNVPNDLRLTLNKSIPYILSIPAVQIWGLFCSTFSNMLQDLFFKFSKLIFSGFSDAGFKVIQYLVVFPQITLSIFNAFVLFDSYKVSEKTFHNPSIIRVNKPIHSPLFIQL